MKKYSVLVNFVLILLLSTNSLAQVAINSTGSAADNSAMLDVVSTSKGILIPRMTESQIMYIDNPVNGLTVFNTGQSCFYFYNATAGEWKEMAISTGTITPWTCGDALIDSRDSKSYTTVQIGTQCWMAENLNIGSSIAGIYNQTDNGTIEKYCYNNNEANCTTYGGLYQWDEMMQYVGPGVEIQGICPEGWHLPTDNEWKTMEMELGMSQSQADATGWRGTTEGGKMKEMGTSHWANPNSLATNESGFTALPGGYRLYNDGVFNNLGLNCDIWLSSESGSNAWYRGLSYNEGGVYRGSNIKTFGFSVRCLKD